jgi:hypothetical protein
MATKARICEPGGEGMFLDNALIGNASLPNIPIGLLFGILLVYCFLGVAMVSDVFMNSIETVTSWRKRVYDKELGRKITVDVWNETVATLTLMALGSSAPEIFLAVIENFKNGFHTGDLGPSTIVGSASFNLFVIIAVCLVVIPPMETRVIQNLNAFFVTAVFSIGAYMWMVFTLVFSSTDVISLWEAVVTLLFLPILVWISYSVDVGFLSRFVPQELEDGDMKLPMNRAHRVGFAQTELSVPGPAEAQTLDVKIVRKGGRRDAAQCTYRTERMSGIPGYDFEEAAGSVDFEKGETEATVQLALPPKSPHSVSKSFRLVLENPEGECDLDPNGDGDDEKTLLTINIEDLGTASSFSKSIDYCFNRNAISFACEEYLSQFVSACLVGGSWEDQAEASLYDWVFHVIAFPWSIILAFIPPPSFFGGWLCFFLFYLWHWHVHRISI